MARVEASVVINRSIEEVFAFVANPQHDEQWESDISDVQQTSEGPMDVGSTFRGVIHFLGQRIEWNSEVTQYQPSNRADFKLAAGPLLLEETVTFEPLEGGTGSRLSTKETQGASSGWRRRLWSACGRDR